MKLLRYGEPGQERPGLIDKNGQIRDLSGHVPDIMGRVLRPEGLAALAALDPDTLPVVTPSRFGPPVAGIGKIVCIGLHYGDHAREAGAETPTEPVIFMKATSALCGPGDAVILPPGARRGDWEVELAIIIGKGGSYIPQAEALSHVAGYTVFNDISERAYQIKRGGQWTKGKSCDTFAPLGPWLVTCDEVPAPQNLRLWLDLNGQRMQDGSTADMIFPVDYIVSYLSAFMSLHPGDVIATGTPAGVGMGKKPPVFLEPGMEMRLGIEGLGEQRQRVAAYGDGGSQ